VIGAIDALGFAKPFVMDSGTKRSLHFAIGETQSRMDVLHPNRLEVSYTRIMMGFLLFVPAPASIGMIGLGGGSLAKFCYSTLHSACIEVSEVNPHVIALREQFAIPDDDHRFKIIRTDGAEFVRASPGRFDGLLVDGYDGAGLPARLGSQSFYDHCASALSANGVMVANLNLDTPRDAQQITRMRRSFGGQALVVEDAGGNKIAFGTNGAVFRDVRRSALFRSAKRTAYDDGPLTRAFTSIDRALASANG